MELAWVAGTATAMGVLSLLVSMVYRWHDVRRLAEQEVNDRAADGPY